MKSPFPGMDPSLQQHWLDVHSRLVLYACDQLQENLPADLLARVEERVYVENEGEPLRSSYPDVRVIERRPGAATGIATQSDVELAEPLIVEFGEEPITERFIKILDARTGNRVISVIEFISPTNKVPGPGYKLYRRKQRELKKTRVALVEIDLVLGGKRVLSVPLYQAVVRRGWQWHKAEVYALPLYKRLPAIPIPLRQTDPDTRLNLQALTEQCYRNGRYDAIDYQADADPPLEGHDAEWADALLRRRGETPMTPPLPQLDYLIIACHPDDAELCCGGTILALKAQGAKVGVLDLTNGEPTPHGSPEIRARECAAATAVLGLDWRGQFPLPNRSLVADLNARKQLAGMIRQLRPSVLITHYWEDAHPDHVAASALVDAARFWAKLSKTDMPGVPHYPARILYFPSMHLRLHFKPSFVLDVTPHHERKMQALACYHSQFIAGRPTAPPTFFDDVIARARYYGWTIGTQFGEPFVCREEVGLRDLRHLV